MNVYSSGIDDNYQKDLITKIKDGDFYIFLVLNKRMEMYALLYDFEQQIIFETKDMDIEIISSEGEHIKSWAEEQLNTYCKKVESKYNKGTYIGYQNSIKAQEIKDEEDELVANIKEKTRKFGIRR